MSSLNQRMERLGFAEALEHYGDQWEALVTKCGLNPSLLPGWINAVLKGHGVVDLARVYVYSDREGIAGILPIVARREHIRRIPARVAMAASSIVSYHQELLPPEGGLSLLETVLSGELAGQWDVFRMAGVPYPSRTAEAIESWTEAHGYTVAVWAGEQSPYLTIERDWSSYLQEQTKRFRANVKRVLRRPMELAGAEMRWFQQDADTAPLFDDILRIEEASWKREQRLAISSRDSELKYYQQLLPFLAQRGMLFANVLYVSDMPVAYVLCAKHAGWIGQLKTSFRANAKDAGACVITASIKRAFELGATEYDFLGDADSHKLKWTSSIRAHRSYTVFARTPVGTMLGVIQRAVESAKRLRELSRSLRT